MRVSVGLNISGSSLTYGYHQLPVAPCPFIGLCPQILLAPFPQISQIADATNFTEDLWVEGFEGGDGVRGGGKMGFGEMLEVIGLEGLNVVGVMNGEFGGGDSAVVAIEASQLTARFGGKGVVVTQETLVATKFVHGHGSRAKLVEAIADDRFDFR